MGLKNTVYTVGLPSSVSGSNKINTTTCHGKCRRSYGGELAKYFQWNPSGKHVFPFLEQFPRIRLMYRAVCRAQVSIRQTSQPAIQDSLSAVLSHSCTLTQLYSVQDSLLAVAQLNKTPSQLYSYTVVLLHSCTLTQLYSHTAVLLHSFTSSQMYSLSAVLLHIGTSSKLYSYTAVLLHIGTSSQLYSHTAVLPLRCTLTQKYFL